MSKQLEDLKRQAVQIAAEMKKAPKDSERYLDLDQQYRQLQTKIISLERAEEKLR
jgi:hypothetical protein